MCSVILSVIESLETRQLLSGSTGSSNLLVHYVGETGGLFASAVPRTSGIDVTGGTSAAHRDTAVTLTVELGPGGGIKETSLRRSQFRIIRNSDNQVVNTANVATSGGGDTITVKPTQLLDANTLYRVEFNLHPTDPKITDVSNIALESATYYFTTGTEYAQGDPDIKFSQQSLISKTSNFGLSAVAISPDHRLYVGTLSGYIYRYTINPDGTLSNEERLDIIRNNNGGARFITGLTFDPRSTDPSNPVLWVSHGQAKFGDTVSTYADNYTGKISRLYGTDLSIYQDVVVNIPRSVKDHLNNQISFDPIKRNLYFVIPSMSAMGRADSTWGNRPEEVSTAALFRLQLQTRGTRIGIEDWLADKGPINLDPNSSNPYNFYKGTNPLRFYAYGIRNAYDMVWHSNGHLYVPANSSSAGGNTPDDPRTTTINESITGVQQSIDDYLFDVVEGGYYGHPNPTRGEYILNGGNPTAGAGNDPQEVRDYPAGVQPESNYRGIAYNFGAHQSPNGVIEYQSDTFGGKLKGQLLIARYAAGADILILKPNPDGTFTQSTADTQGTEGLTNMFQVLDLVEDTTNGNLYSISLDNRTGGAGTIRLHRPLAGDLVANKTKISMYAPPGDMNGRSNSVTITNISSTYSVNIDVSAIKITGRDRRSFVVTNLPSGDFRLRPGQSFTFNVKYVRPAGDTTYRYANLAIASDDPDGLYSTVVQLRGFIEGVPVNSLNPAPRSSTPSTLNTTSSVTNDLFSDRPIEGSEWVLL